MLGHFLMGFVMGMVFVIVIGITVAKEYKDD